MEIKNSPSISQKITKEKDKGNKLSSDLKTVDMAVVQNIEPIVLEKVPVSNNSVDKHIVRALLTTRVKNKEPVDKVIPPVIVNENHAIGIYYFTEIINMKGHSLYHQWLWNDNIIYKRKINILGDRWRAATGKFITHDKQGMWRVRIVDKQGVILDQIVFKVELK